MTVQAPTTKELEQFSQLNELMGGELDQKRGLEVLRQTGGDITKAIDILFSEAPSGGAEVQHVETASSSTQPSRALAPLPEDMGPFAESLISSETEEEQINRALQMSLGKDIEPASQPQFGPSNRQPDANWSMVPAGANTPGATQSNADANVQQAIASSYQDAMAVDQVTEELNLEDLVRQPEAPVSVRVDLPALAYASAVIHALFFTPQVRQIVANLRPPAHVDRHSADDSENALWNFIELFSYLDYSCINVLGDDKAMLSLNPLFFDSVESQPGDLCRKLYTQIAQMVEEAYLVQSDDAEPGLPHIFYFDHMKARLVNGVPQLPTPPYTTRDAVVNVNTGSFLSSGNDLLSRLTDVMGLYSEPQGPQQELEFNAILEPSQVLAFQLSHGSSYVGGYYQASAHATHDGFRFPTSFFLDQFLMQNVETALQLRDARLGMLADIRQCQGRRGLLTRFEESDVLGNLRANAYYFEHVASAKDAPDRTIPPDGIAERLKGIVAKIEQEVAAIDKHIVDVEAKLAQLHDTPALQNVKYDLRAVIMYTGIPGRKSVYSYVQDGREQWWKMVEGSVTEVDEATVLTDPTGMHIGAGPCMLIYSRSVTDEQRWDMDHPRYHEHFMSNVLQCNAQYFEKLPDEVKARIETTWGSADAFIRRGMPSQAVPHPMSPTARSASPSTAMSVDLTRDTPPRGPRPEKPGHVASPSHATSPPSHRNSLRKTSSASRDTIMRDPPLQHRDASVRDVPPHQAREPRDLPPHQTLPREGSMSRVEGPHGPREASMGRSSPSLSRDASMSNP